MSGTDGENTIPHSGSVTLFGVEANNNNGFGALIESTSKIDIKNSSFSNNGPYGLYVSTANKITLDGVTANENFGSGVFAVGFRSLTAENVIANNNRFEDLEEPDGYGLFAASGSKSKVTLDNIQANHNLLGGVLISAGSTVSVKNVVANENDDSGLSIFTYGAVKVNTVSAYNNFYDGVSVSTSSKVSLSGITAGGNGSDGLRVSPLIVGYYDEVTGEWVTIDTLYPSSVILSSSKYGGSAAANKFERNGEDGVGIQARGTIKLYNLDSFENGGCGLNIDNYLLDVETELPAGRGSVIIGTTLPNWANGFQVNGSDGLNVLSNGSVSISKSKANNNNGYGFYVDTTNVIKFTESEANDNGRNGAYLTNMSATRAKSVTVSDSSFNNNNDTGLLVLSMGTISLNGSNAYENHSPTQGGPLVLPITVKDFMYSSDGSENWGFYGSAGDAMDIVVFSNTDGFSPIITIYNSAETWSVTNSTNVIDTNLPGDDWYRIEVTFEGLFEGQGFYTLHINDEDGDNTVYPGSGVALNNASGKGSVKIYTTKTNPENHFDGNAGMGIDIKTNGSITIKNLNANENIRSGAFMVNPQSKGRVTFTDKTNGSNFFNNHENGIGILTMGSISLSGINADENGSVGIGAHSINMDDPTISTGSVTLKNISVIHSGDKGIYVIANGAISLSSVFSIENFNEGIYLQNDLSERARNITLKDVSTVSNNNMGMMILTNGKVTISGVEANDNHKIFGDIMPGSAVSDYYNADMGPDELWFQGSTGTTLTFRLYASDNPDWDINNYHGKLELYDQSGNLLAFDTVEGEGTNALVATWTVPEYSSYYVHISEQSETDGFYRFSIDNETFDSMDYYYIDGLSINAGSTVSISGRKPNYITHNSLTGLFVTTPGNIVLKNIIVNGNGTEGANLNNELEGAGTGSVTISGNNSKTYSKFASNGWEGVKITTNGPVSAKYVAAYSNGGHGMQILTNSKFTGSYIEASANGMDGLMVNGVGKATVSNTIAQANGQNGIWIRTEDDVKVSKNIYMSENGNDGLYIQTAGSVNLIGADVRRNGGKGISAELFGEGKITLKKIFVEGSGMDGINLINNAASTVTITDVTSFNNGGGSDGHGLVASFHDPENSKIVIKKSVFMGNEGSGIRTDSYGGTFVERIFDYYSMVFNGNDTNNSGDNNIVGYRW